MLFLDEKQLLRCRGRINNSSLPQTSKNPILLPSSHRYVDLLIRHTHELVKHSAMTNTLTTLRERFWILKGRQAVKGVLKRCVRCRKLEGLPYSSYNSPDLPSFRVSDDPPFTHTGLDFAYTPAQMEIKTRKMPNVMYVYSLACLRELFSLSYYEV